MPCPTALCPGLAAWQNHDMKRLPVILLGLVLASGLLLSACGDDDDSAADAPTNDEVLLAVAEALVAKNGWDPDDVEISLDRIEDGQYATGGVRDVPAGGGGLWFAALVNGDWQIVWDGNGIIDCPSIEPYPGFPTSMIPQCVATNGDLQQRD
jgi:hypothetical protein